MKKIAPLLIGIFIVITACNRTVEAPKEVTVKDLYSIEVTSTLGEFKELQKDASLQYGNRFLELYVVVIDEVKNTFDSAVQAHGETPGLEIYAKEALSYYEGAENYQLENTQKKSINGLDAITFDIAAKVQGIDVFYNVGVFEGKEHYYRVIAWTVQNNKEAQQENMLKMIDSFKEL